jgi:hypothetical protein
LVELPGLKGSRWQKETRNAQAPYIYPLRLCTAFLTYFGNAKIIEIQSIKNDCTIPVKIFFCILPIHLAGRILDESASFYRK